jgi:NAD(P) transhydrogenase subunit alpha
MKIVIPKEQCSHEKRVAVTPESVKKLLALNCEVIVEAGAGQGCFIRDEDFSQAGAQVVSMIDPCLQQADIVLVVQPPLLAGDGGRLHHMRRGAVLIGSLAPYSNSSALQAYAHQGVTAIAMEMIPRITRAQSMDVLSSQSSLAGYRAVLDAVYEYGRAIPMMMTAAGTIPPAKVMILGAGVAGLQAIATAKRLGAIVSATDVRPAVKEQVESLGGKFVMVESPEVSGAETAGGYAKEMSDDFKRRQADLIAQTIKKQDIVICTALIPGRKAPVLVNDDMVRSMRPGSIIVDLAVEQGGNCTLSRSGEIVNVNGVIIIGHVNMPSRVAGDASVLYANNLVNFLKLLLSDRQSTDPQTLAINFDDEIIRSSVLTHDGSIVHPAFKQEGN